MDALEDEHAARPFHRKRWFRRLLLPCSVSVAFFVVGMWLYLTRPRLVSGSLLALPHTMHMQYATIYDSVGNTRARPAAQAVWRFEVWRWLLFIAGTAPLYGFSRLVVYVLIVGSERYHPLRGAIYYVIGIRVRAHAPAAG